MTARPPLDRDVATLLAAAAQSGAPALADLSVEQLRARVAAGNVLCHGGPETVTTEDTAIERPGGPALAVRTYRPPTSSAGALVYLHGGGWVSGDLDYADEACRELAHGLGLTVFSIDYRLAPEHAYPAAVEDAFDACLWVAAQPRDGGGLFIAGDSAGGALAAACTLLARDRGGPPIDGALLIYPVTDHDLTRDSYTRNAGYLLGPTEMAWFWAHYAPDEVRRSEPSASPLRAGSHEGLPPTVLLLAGYDPLLDEGRAYANALRGAGVTVIELEAPTLPHGFLRLSGAVPAAGSSFQEALNAFSGLVADVRTRR